MRGDLSYAPSLTYDFRSKGDPDVLHRGFATGTYRVARGTTLTASENVAYGHRDFRPLAPQPQDPAQTLPAVVDPKLAQLGVVSYLQWGTGLGIDQLLGPGIVLGVHGSYGAGGVTHSDLVFGRKVVSAARVALDTAIDPVGGRTYSRIEGSLSLGFVPRRDLSFQLRGSGARGLTSRPELRNGLWQLEGTSSYSF